MSNSSKRRVPQKKKGEMLADVVKPEFTDQAGRTWRLKFTFETVLDYEAATGESFMAMLGDMQAFSASALWRMAYLSVAKAAAEAGCKVYEDWMELIGPGALGMLTVAASVALSAFFPEAEVSDRPTAASPGVGKPSTASGLSRAVTSAH